MRTPRRILAVLLGLGALAAAPWPASSSALGVRSGGVEYLVLSDPGGAGEIRLRATADGVRVGFERAAIVWEIPMASGERDVVRADFPASGGAAKLEAVRAPDVRLPADVAAARSSAYAEVRYREIAPGADLVCTASAGRLATAIHVAAGASVSDVRLRWRGVRALAVERSGALDLETGGGTRRIGRPRLHQLHDGARVPVNGGFRVIGRNELGFWAGEHDATRTLILEIDSPE